MPSFMEENYGHWVVNSRNIFTVDSLIYVNKYDFSNNYGVYSKLGLGSFTIKLAAKQKLGCDL
jgi:hypothetical protein